jgi:hypothetical protein
MRVGSGVGVGEAQEVRRVAVRRIRNLRLQIADFRLKD